MIQNPWNLVSSLCTSCVSCLSCPFLVIVCSIIDVSIKFTYYIYYWFSYLAGLKGHFFTGKKPTLRDPEDPEYEGQKQVKIFGLTVQEKAWMRGLFLSMFSVPQLEDMCVLLCCFSTVLWTYIPVRQFWNVVNIRDLVCKDLASNFYITIADCF